MALKRKRKRKKKKKTKSPGFGQLYIDVIKDRDNSPKQKKINKMMLKPNKKAADWKLLGKLLTEDRKKRKTSNSK